MKRWLTRILICLILGAVTTVAVAWGCAVLMAWGPSKIVSVPIGKTMWRHTFVSTGFGVTVNGWWEAAFIIKNSVFTQMGAGDESFGTEMQTGFPFRAASCEYPDYVVVYSRGGSAAPPNQSAEVVGGIHLRWLSMTDRPAALPLRPIWPGLVIDTLLYAVLWHGLFLIWPRLRSYVRREKQRIEQGCCPLCGYDLRADFNSGCPECGWGRVGAKSS